MEQITVALNWLVGHGPQIASWVTQIIGWASVVVAVIPTLSKDNWILPIIKAIAKYIALNKNVSDADRPGVTTPPAK